MWIGLCLFVVTTAQRAAAPEPVRGAAATATAAPANAWSELIPSGLTTPWPTEIELAELPKTDDPGAKRWDFDTSLDEDPAAAAKPIDRTQWFFPDLHLDSLGDRTPPDTDVASWRDWRGNPAPGNSFWSIGFHLGENVRWTMTDVTSQVNRFSELESGEAVEFQIVYRF